MPAAVTKLVAATTTLLLAGLGVTFSAVPANADLDSLCEGMSAPQKVHPGNRAPALAADTATAVAGGSATLKVLANDSDPDGDRLYVVGASQPARGESCVDGNGEVEFFAAPSPTDYVATFTYGVTDGEFYRTAAVSVSVAGIKPVRAQLKHRLTYAKGTTRVKHKARIAFTNSNKRWVIVMAGDPRKQNPSIQRAIAPGKTTAYTTKVKRVVYLTLIRDASGQPVLVNVGFLNTHTGRQTSVTPGEDFRSSSWEPSVARRWLRQ